MAAQHEARESVHCDASGLAETYAGHLGLFVVGDHPDVRERNERDHLGADADILTGADLPFADHSIDWRSDAGVAEGDVGEIARRLLRLERGVGLLFLALQYIQLLALLRQLRLVESESGLRALFIVDGLFHELFVPANLVTSKFCWRTVSRW